MLHTKNRQTKLLSPSSHHDCVMQCDTTMLFYGWHGLLFRCAKHYNRASAPYLVQAADHAQGLSVRGNEDTLKALLTCHAWFAWQACTSRAYRLQDGRLYVWAEDMLPVLPPDMSTPASAYERAAHEACKTWMSGLDFKRYVPPASSYAEGSGLAPGAFFASEHVRAPLRLYTMFEAKRCRRKAVKRIMVDGMKFRFRWPAEQRRQSKQDRRGGGSDRSYTQRRGIGAADPDSRTAGEGTRCSINKMATESIVGRRKSGGGGGGGGADISDDDTITLKYTYERLATIFMLPLRSCLVADRTIVARSLSIT